VAIVAAAALVGVSVLVGLVLKVPESESLDRSPLAYWGAAPLALLPEPDAGPIVVSIEYSVLPDQEAAFLLAMESMRRSRLRSGAARWDLYRVGESPDRFLEQFQVPTWAEHQRQHDGRLTAEDQAIETATFALVEGTPRTQHLLPPDAARESLSPGR
jgi:hypothetical protein